MGFQSLIHKPWYINQPLWAKQRTSITFASLYSRHYALLKLKISGFFLYHPKIPRNHDYSKKASRCGNIIGECNLSWVLMPLRRESRLEGAETGTLTLILTYTFHFVSSGLYREGGLYRGILGPRNRKARNTENLLRKQKSR